MHKSTIAITIGVSIWCSEAASRR